MKVTDLPLWHLDKKVNKHDRQQTLSLLPIERRTHYTAWTNHIAPTECRLANHGTVQFEYYYAGKTLRHHMTSPKPDISRYNRFTFQHTHLMRVIYPNVVLSPSPIGVFQNLVLVILSSAHLPSCHPLGYIRSASPFCLQSPVRSGSEHQYASSADDP